MDNEREILSLYYDSNNFRQVMRRPFLQGGKVCASDGHVLIRIDESLCDGKYEEKPDGLTPPNVACVVPQPTIDDPLTRLMLLDALHGAPGEDCRQCPECAGVGIVTWEYRDRFYVKHTMEHECPECGGDGHVDPYIVNKYQFSIHGLSLCHHHVVTLLKTMIYMDVDELRLRHAQTDGNTPRALLFASGGVEIVMMPQVREYNMLEVTII